MTEARDEEVFHHELETSRNEPSVQIAEIVASHEDTNEESLTPVYNQIDHVISHIFSDPPDPSAEVEVTFSYEQYRITVEQNGEATFVRTK
ncbi:HalOD1 output domain-containing protein [Halobacterium zhouii]|uniref:HalOD1 output domain-containing protein n=1 Tax=Halobacterium zhouii TaxID=2902624 RepID=UPI001E42B714|nr:HalOD1 output domain-containing protein [Halobacterium zhouii]